MAKLYLKKKLYSLKEEKTIILNHFKHLDEIISQSTNTSPKVNEDDQSTHATL